MRRRIVVMVMVSGLSLVSRFAAADVIVDTGSNSVSGGYLLVDSSLNPPYGQQFAAEFTTGQPYTVTSLGAYLTNYQRPEATIDLRIYADHSGLPSNNGLADYLYETAPIDVPADPSYYSDVLHSTTVSWNLPAGTYWIAVIAESGYPLTTHPTTAMSQYAQIFDSSGWRIDSYDTGAFQILGTPAPEPASLALLLSGGLLFLRRRRGV